MKIVHYKGFAWIVKYIGKSVDRETMLRVQKRHDADMCLKRGNEYYYVEIIEDIDFEEIH